MAQTPNWQIPYPDLDDPADIVGEQTGSGIDDLAMRIDALLTQLRAAGAMPGELPYIAGKGALHQLTASLAAACAPKRITVNCVDPGATDTGWASPAVRAEVLAEEPFGRWGEPDDAARLIAWLCSDDGGWITGQVIDSEGGFRR